jgi:peptide deformylase
LRRPADPIEKITPEIEEIWRDMIAVMEAMPGVGLAAPQLGIGLRLAVVDASSARGEVLRMANPEILHVSAKLRDGALYERNWRLAGKRSGWPLGPLDAPSGRSPQWADVF